MKSTWWCMCRCALYPNFHRTFKLHPCFIPLFRGRLAALESGRGGASFLSTGSSVRLLLVQEIFMAFFWSVSILRTNEALGDWALWRADRSNRDFNSIHGRKNAHKPDLGTKGNERLGDHLPPPSLLKMFSSLNLRKERSLRSLTLAFNQTIALFNKHRSVPMHVA